MRISWVRTFARGLKSAQGLKPRGFELRLFRGMNAPAPSGEVGFALGANWVALVVPTLAANAAARIGHPHLWWCVGWATRHIPAPLVMHRGAVASLALHFFVVIVVWKMGSLLDTRRCPLRIKEVLRLRNGLS